MTRHGERTTARAAAGTAAAAVFIGLSAVPTSASAYEPVLAHLQPGEQVTYTEDVPVNVVYLGLEPLDEEQILDQLPPTYQPVVRQPLQRGFDARPLGLEYRLDYQFIHADDRLTDRFFEFLGRAGAPGPRTDAQAQYNDQSGNRLEIPDEVWHVDAQAVEHWLNTRARGTLGLDRNAYTVYYLNGYGRADFQFHVYTLDLPADPDTGEVPRQRDLTGWGGADERSWFYDFSAGPNQFGGGWNVDDADLTGDGQPDYRIPPAWEYHPDGHRDPGVLAADLARITRYVALNLLFTPSATYDPLASRPGPGGTKVAHLHLLQDDPGGGGAAMLDSTTLLGQLAGLQPYYDWELRFTESDPVSADERHTLDVWSVFWRDGDFPDDPGCWEPYGHPAAQLFCYFEAHHDRYFPAAGPTDYVLPTAVIDIRDQIYPIGWGGIADHNWADGTPSYAYAITSPSGRAEAGAGFTGLTIHEMAHHIGLSHTYDGYDPTDELHYGPSGDTYFVDLGKQVHSVMADPVIVEFSRFERENLARWDTAGHLNEANALAGQVLEHPDADRVRGMIHAADRSAGAAAGHLAGGRYVAAAQAAIRAYDQLARAAERLGLGLDVVPG